jgi:hypothetical protein
LRGVESLAGKRTNEAEDRPRQRLSGARRGKAQGVTRLCEDCGAHAEWLLSSVRSEAVDPPDVTDTGACAEHRLDATENLLVRYGNVTIVETLG